MSSLRDWNVEQWRVFRRYCRRYGVLLTPDLVMQLAARYARKHRRDRPAVARSRPVRHGAGLPARAVSAR